MRGGALTLNEVAWRHVRSYIYAGHMISEKGTNCRVCGKHFFFLTGMKGTRLVSMHYCSRECKRQGGERITALYNAWRRGLRAAAREGGRCRVRPLRMLILARLPASLKVRPTAAGEIGLRPRPRKTGSEVGRSWGLALALA